MKRVLLTIALTGLAFGAWAQDTYYAEMLSRNNYYGTARSVALGNAMTALGGDLGSIGINPAGGAVNEFGQLTITPAMLFQSSSTAWSVNGYDNYTQSASPTRHSRFNIPNVGANIVLYPDVSSDLKYITMGFIVNSSNTFLNDVEARGTNDSNSFLGNLAGAASGDERWRYNSYSSFYAAFRANQIGAFGGSGSGQFSGSNQMVDPGDQYAYVPGTLNQKARYYTYGTKSDILINMAFNLADRFYFGFNLGLPSVKYSREDEFSEWAAQPVSFPVNFVDGNGKHQGVEGEPTTYYDSSYNKYKLNTEASGIYGKFGFIWLPVEDLRLGAAIQTPSMLDIKENWQYSAKSWYENSAYNGEWNGDVDEYEYTLRTPYVLDLGAAFTIGGAGLVSVDYELTDYSVMRYAESDFSESDWCRSVNRCNKLFCGVSHSLRAGVEIRPLPELSLRAGYSLITDPERFAYDEAGNMVTADNWDSKRDPVLSDFQYFKNITNAYSFGVGYASRGSFFADAAIRLTRYPQLHYSPYYYSGLEEVRNKDGEWVFAGTPDITYDRKVFDVLVTIGWRF